MKFRPMRGLQVALTRTRQEAAAAALRQAATEMRCDFDRQVLLAAASAMESQLAEERAR